MNKLIVRIFFVLILLLAFLSASSQGIEKVSQKLNFQFEYEEGMTLDMTAEKTKITIDGWDREYYSVNVLKLSENESGAIAEEELQYIEVDAHKNGKKIVVAQSFVAPAKKKKITSNLTTEYRIKVPSESSVAVQMGYGKIKLHLINGSIRVNSKFTQVEVSNCTSDVSLYALFGDVDIVACKGNLSMRLQRVDAQIKSSQMDANVESTYGKVLVDLDALNTLEMDGQRTAVDLVATDVSKWNYDLSVEKGEIDLPASLKSADVSNFIFENPDTAHKVRVSTTYAPIKIKQNERD